MKLLLKIAVIVISFMIIGCGNGENSIDNKEQTTSDEEEQTATDANEQVEDSAIMYGGVKADDFYEQEEFLKTLNEDTTTMILSNIFTIEKIMTAERDKEKIRILSGMKGDAYFSIPLNRCFLVQLSDELAALAFELYLSDNQNDYKDFLERSSPSTMDEEFEYASALNKNKQKSIEVVFHVFYG